MNKRILLYGAAVLLVLGLIFMFFNSSSRSHYDWTEVYKKDVKQPYNISFIYNYIEKACTNGKGISLLNNRIHEALPFKKAAEEANYVFIGRSFYLSAEDADSLTRFVEHGGQAFIATSSMPYELMDYLYFKDCYDAEWRDFYAVEDTIAHLNFVHPQLVSPKPYDYKFKVGLETQTYRWRALDSLYMCDDNMSGSSDSIATISSNSDEDEFEESSEPDENLKRQIPRSGFVPLGYMTIRNENHINFVKLKYGKGTFFIHTTPLAFTDYALSTAEGQAYAEKILCHLNPALTYWDARSASPDYAHNDTERRNVDRNEKSSPLKAILLEDELRWAWYILLGLALLYLLFGAKRRQRVIPVLAENSNTSMAFIETLGRLHFRQQNHHDLAVQQMKIFQNHLRERYNLNIKEAVDVLIPKIAKRSELPQERIASIYDTYRDIETDLSAPANKLIALHSALHYFYTNAK